MQKRIFTVDDANALIPSLEQTLLRIRELRDAIGTRMEKLQVLDALWGEKVMSPSNPDHAEFSEHRAEVKRAAGAIEDVVNTEIIDRGLRFPAGGLEHGLIDFPTTYQGRWIYLCWRSSEPRIIAWHEVDGGFAGRRTLTAEQSRRMGREE
jgi:hypothetical protein